MLFFYNRVLLAAIIASAFLQFTFARPVPIFDVKHTITFDNEIANLKLKSHHAKEVKNWHKNHVINAMNTNPLLKGIVHSAEIHHTAHQHGSHPNEKNHITVEFHRKDGTKIPNTFNGGPLHHIYVPKGNPGLIKEGRKALEKVNIALRKEAHRKIAHAHG